MVTCSVVIVHHCYYDLLIQELKLSNAHFVDFSVFWGTQVLGKGIYLAFSLGGMDLDICSASER